MHLYTRRFTSESNHQLPVLKPDRNRITPEMIHGKPSIPLLRRPQALAAKAENAGGGHPTTGSRPWLPTDGTFGAKIKKQP